MMMTKRNISYVYGNWFHDWFYIISVYQYVLIHAGYPKGSITQRY